MKNGLRGKLLAILLIPVVLVVAGLSFYNYYSAKEALDWQITRTLTFITGNYVGKINEELVDKETVAESLAAYMAAKPVDMGELAAMQRALKASNKGVLNVFAGLENKRYLETNGWVPKADYDPTQRDWYKKAVAANDVVYSDVYEDAGTKQLVVSVCKKVVGSDGRLIGVAAVDLDLKQYADIAQEMVLGKTGYGFIIDSKGHYIYHPQLKLTENILKVQNGAFAEAGKNFLSGKPVIDTFAFGGIERFYSSTPIGKTGWVLVGTTPVTEVFERVTAMGWTSLIICAAAVLLLTGVILYATRKITQPIAELAVIAGRMAEGDLATDTQRLADNAPQDEIGMLIKSFHEMKRQLRQLIRQVASATEQVAASAEQLTASADQSAQAANQVAISITEVANGTTQQLAVANETSAAAQQMSASVRQIADSANAVAGQSAKAADKANSGSGEVEKAVTQMTRLEDVVNASANIVAELGERSKEIGQIVDTISGIAGQTNLLALNAAIEAARAGEQGRGFAVVAEEVRKLAEQSQDATEQIADLIGQIQSETEKAVAAMSSGTREAKRGAEVVNSSGQAFREIVLLINQVSGQVADISSAIEQMAVGNRHIVGSIERIDSLSKQSAGETQTVSAATEEQSASMEEIASSSQALARLAEDLQTAVNKFKI